jgi:predicted house-cleaning noncanonical NTP pyrophosphatase (MazG superfamily)
VPPCSYCGYNILNRLNIVNLGYELYEEFPKYMGIQRDRLPNNIIINSNQYNAALGRCGYDKQLGKFVISMQGLDFHGKHDLIPMYFHEFTHIYDHYSPENDGPVDEKDDLKWATEFHASQIEMKKVLGYEKNDDNKPFRITSKVIYDRKVITVSEYIDKLIKEYLDDIREFFRQGANEEANISIMVILGYTYGKISVLSTYIDESVINQIPGIIALNDYFRDISIYNDNDLSKQISRLNNYAYKYKDKGDLFEVNDIMREISMLLMSRVKGYEHFRSLEAFIEHAVNKKEAI